MLRFFNFRIMVSTWLIKILYALGALSLTSFGVFGMAAILTDNREKDSYFLMGIGALTLGNLLWRFICEGFILIFSIHDVLQSIEKNSIKPSPIS